MFKKIMSLAFFMVVSISASAIDFESTKAKAEQGDSTAIFHLAMLYFSGDGVQQDYRKAVELFQKAADMGNTSAMNNLGYLYKDGKGVIQNSSKAASLYQQAINLGDINAIDSLGELYRDAKDLRDLKKAKMLFERACDKKLYESCYKAQHLK